MNDQPGMTKIEARILTELRAIRMALESMNPAVNSGPVVTTERAGEMLSCSRSQVFRLIATGELREAPRVGRKTTVYTSSVLRILDVGIKKPVRQRRSRMSPEDNEIARRSLRWSR